MRNGQITISSAGTSQSGPDISGNIFAFSAHPDNTDTVWVGSDETSAPAVSSSDGFPLDPGVIIPLAVGNISHIQFDADVSGEVVCWIRMS